MRVDAVGVDVLAALDDVRELLDYGRVLVLLWVFVRLDHEVRAKLLAQLLQLGHGVGVALARDQDGLPVVLVHLLLVREREAVDADALVVGHVQVVHFWARELDKGQVDEALVQVHLQLLQLGGFTDADLLYQLLALVEDVYLEQPPGGRVGVLQVVVLAVQNVDLVQIEIVLLQVLDQAGRRVVERVHGVQVVLIGLARRVDLLNELNRRLVVDVVIGLLVVVTQDYARVLCMLALRQLLQETDLGATELDGVLLYLALLLQGAEQAAADGAVVVVAQFLGDSCEDH